MMTFDPVPALQAFGYTEREAAFLYLVAAHSGYFLRRQFDYFIDRNKGSIATRFLAKAREAGHVEVLDYKQGWFVYHLCSRAIYRLCGDPESQFRRRKADARVRARLMELDYILANETGHYLSSKEERLHFFEDVRGVAPELFEQHREKLYALLASTPIAITDRKNPALSLVRFVFIDEGLADLGRFKRYLDTVEPLLLWLGNFEVVYVANSESMFRTVKAVFWARFSRSSQRDRSLFEDDFEMRRPSFQRSIRASLTTVLFKYSYPALQRSKRRGSEGVRRLVPS